MSRDDALIRLGSTTAEAVSSVLRMFAPEGIEFGAPSIVAGGPGSIDSLPVPAVASSVAYVDGVTGGNLFVIAQAGAKKLAAAMMGEEPQDLDSELSELELSAVAEAMNQMMASAAAATGTVLEQEVEISAPETRILTSSGDLQLAEDEAAHTISVAFSVLGETARLLQLVPNAFVVRMTRAFAEREGVVEGPGGSGETLSVDAIWRVPVRVWAELGRTRLPIGRAVGLAPQTVVELDHEADEPVDLFVSGRRFGRGSLVLADGEWAVRLIELTSDESTVSTVSDQEGEPR
jgi:flagellar motor switch protein FliN/FliY